MKILRTGVFETNSSSSHSISLQVVSKEDFTKWQNDEVVWDINENKFISIKDERIKWNYDYDRATEEQVKNAMETGNFDDMSIDNYEDFLTFDQFEDQEHAKVEYKDFTVGDSNIVAFYASGDEY